MGRKPDDKRHIVAPARHNRSLIYLTTMGKHSVSLGLRTYRLSSRVMMNLTMAASVIVMIPHLLIFAFAHRYYIQGVVVSVIKGWNRVDANNWTLSAA